MPQPQRAEGSVQGSPNAPWAAPVLHGQHAAEASVLGLSLGPSLSSRTCGPLPLIMLTRSACCVLCPLLLVSVLCSGDCVVSLRLRAPDPSPPSYTALDRSFPRLGPRDEPSEGTPTLAPARLRLRVHRTHNTFCYAPAAAPLLLKSSCLARNGPLHHLSDQTQPAWCLCRRLPARPRPHSLRPHILCNRNRSRYSPDQCYRLRSSLSPLFQRTHHHRLPIRHPATADGATKRPITQPPTRPTSL
ncbi:hypothetical protein BDV95DRAFT_384842 [Massariosphaeria phaeospora]|uniref:Uncharacterized protein n=1 Tax=Massariosphaeria phaeospora TaxID=100035 RepID=A0A7C8MM02_9PLEO|nr:hypothetical protein BDV95DRAFT_384842 [Massariosphaeria phaeospora]